MSGSGEVDADIRSMRKLDFDDCGGRETEETELIVNNLDGGTHKRRTTAS